MVIYLKHKIHGTKVACSDLEASRDEANGWVRFDPNAEAKAKDAAVLHEQEAKATEAEKVPATPKPRGRPPKKKVA